MSLKNSCWINVKNFNTNKLRYFRKRRDEITWKKKGTNERQNILFILPKLFITNSFDPLDFFFIIVRIIINSLSMFFVYWEQSLFFQSSICSFKTFFSFFHWKVFVTDVYLICIPIGRQLDGPALPVQRQIINDV